MKNISGLDIFEFGAISMIVILLVFLVGLIFCALIFGIGVPGGLIPTYSEGERTGVVVKVSYCGLIWKSYEAEMNVGGASNNSDGNIAPEIWQFSTRDKAIAEKLEVVSREHIRCTIKYNNFFIKPIETSTPYKANEIIVIKGEINEK